MLSNFTILKTNKIKGKSDFNMYYSELSIEDAKYKEKALNLNDNNDYYYNRWLIKTVIYLKSNVSKSVLYYACRDGLDYIEEIDFNLTESLSYIN